MAELEKGRVSLEELMVTTLAMADAVTKLLIEKGIITDAEFKQKLLENVSSPAHPESHSAVTSAHQKGSKFLHYLET